MGCVCTELFTVVFIVWKRSCVKHLIRWICYGDFCFEGFRIYLLLRFQGDSFSGCVFLRSAASVIKRTTLKGRLLSTTESSGVILPMLRVSSIYWAKVSSNGEHVSEHLKTKKVRWSFVADGRSVCKTLSTKCFASCTCIRAPQHCICLSLHFNHSVVLKQNYHCCQALTDSNQNSLQCVSSNEQEICNRSWYLTWCGVHSVICWMLYYCK